MVFVESAIFSTDQTQLNYERFRECSNDLQSLLFRLFPTRCGRLFNPPKTMLSIELKSLEIAGEEVRCAEAGIWMCHSASDTTHSESKILISMGFVVSRHLKAAEALACAKYLSSARIDVTNNASQDYNGQDWPRFVFTANCVACTIARKRHDASWLYFANPAPAKASTTLYHYILHSSVSFLAI